MSRWDERESFSSRRSRKNKVLRWNEPGTWEAGCGQGSRAAREEVGHEVRGPGGSRQGDGKSFSCTGSRVRSGAWQTGLTCTLERSLLALWQMDLSTGSSDLG